MRKPTPPGSIPDSTPATAPVPARTPNVSIQSKKVIIVHGHDNGSREAVAQFIEKIGLQAIILAEQANQERTIIDKVEAHGDVAFAIILLTPGDVGSKAGGTLRQRARQNVLVEFGHFIGRMGRSRVCAFATSDAMELPTDFAGVVWEPLDAAGGWKTSLARELRAACFTVDWNRVMEL
jgi:predicted nucleotide-binding protein